MLLCELANRWDILCITMRAKVMKGEMKRGDVDNRVGVSV